MRKGLRILAVVLIVAAITFWAAKGMNKGWTKDRVPVTTVDEVTGIEGITYDERFVPGVDFLGAAGLGAVALFGASFLFRNKKTGTTSSS